jgi:hypothetical protein
MQIVIDIDDNLYTRLFDNGVDNYDDAVDMAKSIRKGTPLPKRHGRLIDADELKRTMEKDKRKALSFVDLIDFIWLAQTIIEADGGESE